jgi:hypothetical protein
VTSSVEGAAMRAIEIEAYGNPARKSEAANESQLS